MEKLLQVNLADMEAGFDNWYQLTPVERFDLTATIRQRLGDSDAGFDHNAGIEKTEEDFYNHIKLYFKHQRYPKEDLDTARNQVVSLGLDDSYSHIIALATRRYVNKAKRSLYGAVIRNNGKYTTNTLRMLDGIKGMEIFTSNAVSAHLSKSPRRSDFNGHSNLFPQGHFMYINLDPNVWDSARSELHADLRGDKLVRWQLNYLWDQTPGTRQLIAPYESSGAMGGGVLAAGNVYLHYYSLLQEVS